MSIQIFYDNTLFRIKNWRKVKKLVEKVISEEGKISGDLNFIVTNDTILKEINTKFLKHNYFTDVVSFDYSEDDTVTGEVYISIDNVKKNARNYEVSCENELIRVIIHGVLHICGYDDRTGIERNVMRRVENYWLMVYSEM